MKESQLIPKVAQSAIPVIGRATWEVFLLLVWAVWWGGLCFYALVVVPIGTELMGSVEQGFMTQRVTIWHNSLSLLFLGCLLIETQHRGSYGLWAIVAMLAIITAALFLWHFQLTGMMDFQQRSVPISFYGQHAIYLWITAAEWLLGMAIPFWITLPSMAVKTETIDHFKPRQS